MVVGAAVPVSKIRAMVVLAVAIIKETLILQTGQEATLATATIKIPS